MGSSGTRILSPPVLKEHPGVSRPQTGGPLCEPQKEKTGATWEEQVRVNSQPPALPPNQDPLSPLSPRQPWPCSSSPHPASRTWASAETRRRSKMPRSAPRGASWLEDLRGSDPPAPFWLTQGLEQSFDSEPCSSPGPDKPGNHVCVHTHSHTHVLKFIFIDFYFVNLSHFVHSSGRNCIVLRICQFHLKFHIY